MVSATDFAMPSLGADMDDGVIVEWLIEPGDRVSRGQVVAVVETDKSEIEVEIFQDARVEELLVPAGVRVAVGTPIARLGGVVGAESTTAASQRQGSITSPVLRRLADRLDVDQAMLVGSGAGGRVRRDDLMAAVATRPQRRLTPRARRLAAEGGVDPSSLPGDSVITGADIEDVSARGVEVRDRGSHGPAVSDPVAETDPMRARIASLMERSWAEIPHFHISDRIDLTEMLDRLEVHNSRVGPAGRVLPAAVLLCAVARAARRVPAVNGWWIDGAFEAAAAVDLAVVVARRGGGIIAPTIGSADELGIVEMMEQLNGVVGRARAQRLRTTDTAPASLTVTNLGDLGAETVHGVILAPQVALVGFGAIREHVVAVDGLIGVRPMVSATITGDHRSFDGLVAARFLGQIAAEIVPVIAGLDTARSVSDRIDDLGGDLVEERR